MNIRWQGDLEKVNVELYNYQGALIQSQNVVNQGNINLKDLPKGLYLCQIKTEKGILQTSKIVVE